jgi:LDH2 family malate/lactate/ureidoglycolate dehydrogenase
MGELRVSADGLEKLCAQVFVADGMSRENARIVSRSLIFADLRGVSSHGMVRLETYVRRSHKEHWNANPKFTYTNIFPAVTVLDGDDGFGSLVGTAAMKKAVEMAKKYGMGVCAAHHSSHFGMAAYYPMLALGENMIGFSCTNGMPNLAHFGSMEGMLGTNPFSVAIPVADRYPMVLDVSCSVTARGNIANAKREGRQIPDGWAIDKDGHPTNDPAAALDGWVLPFAGHKGSGLAIVVDALAGVLSGAAFGLQLREAQKEGSTAGPNVGHFFAAVNPGAFGDADAFMLRMKEQVDRLKSAKPAPSFKEILVPGELEARKEAYNRENGILMGTGAWREFCDTCKAYGVREDPSQYILSGQPE